MEIIVASTIMSLMMMGLIIMDLMGLLMGLVGGGIMGLVIIMGFVALMIRILSLTIMPRMYAQNVVNVLIL